MENIMEAFEKDLEFIEQFYSDFERGMRSAGRSYTRPLDYIERATRVIHEARNITKHNTEGRKKSMNDNFRGEN
jgi:hypothetical protein